MKRRTFFAVLLAFAALVVPARADQSVLYEKASAYSTIIVTEDGEGLRTLRFEKAGQPSGGRPIAVNRPVQAAGNLI